MIGWLIGFVLGMIIGSFWLVSWLIGVRVTWSRTYHWRGVRIRVTNRHGRRWDRW